MKIKIVLLFTLPNINLFQIQEKLMLGFYKRPESKQTIKRWCTKFYALEHFGHIPLTIKLYSCAIKSGGRLISGITFSIQVTE